MKTKKMLTGLVLLFSVVLVSPVALLAGEHGGEHGGTTSTLGSAASTVTNPAAKLREAAQILKREGHDDLAADLEAIAKMKIK